MKKSHELFCNQLRDSITIIDGVVSELGLEIASYDENDKGISPELFIGGKYGEDFNESHEYVRVSVIDGELMCMSSTTGEVLENQLYDKLIEVVKRYT